MTFDGKEYIDGDCLNGFSSATITFNLNNMFNASLFDTGYKYGYQITSIAMLGRDDTNRMPAASTLSFTIGDKVYTSENIEYVTTATNRYDVVYNFSKGPVITTLGQLDATITNNSEVGYTCAQAKNNATLTGISPTQNLWAPVAQVTLTKVVPEPSSATLSLLALAGLCSRRRRK